MYITVLCCKLTSGYDSAKNNKIV